MSELSLFDLMRRLSPPEQMLVLHFFEVFRAARCDEDLEKVCCELCSDYWMGLCPGEGRKGPEEVWACMVEKARESEGGFF